MNDNVEDTSIIKKGFNNSIGWYLGNGPPKSIHLLEPLTSTPIKGTKSKLVKNIKNNSRLKFIKFLLSTNERNNRTRNPNKTKAECLMKK